MQAFSFAAVRSTLLAGLGLALLLAGCATTPEPVAPRAISASGASSQSPAAEPRRTPPYRLEVGDRIAIEFPYARELNADARVRPDGRITVPRAGEVEALGLTPVELERALAAALAKSLARPDPRVVVREFRTPQIFVGGAVRAPGAFDFHERLTALRAITAAGGIANGGALEAVVILREAADGSMRRFRLDLRAPLQSSTASDPLLEPNDLVFVPRDGAVGEVSEASGRTPYATPARGIAQARP